MIQVDRIFRDTELMRPKWDSKRGNSTWGRNEIIKAYAFLDCDSLIPARISTNELPSSPNIRRQNTKLPEPLGEAAFYGLAGEIVRLIEPNTEADNAAILVQLLAAFGSLIGHSSFFRVESDRHYCNLFAVIVGQSSRARKGTSFGHIRRLMLLVDEDFLDRTVNGISSGEGIIYQVRDASIQVVQRRGSPQVEGDSGVSDKRLLIMEAEFARVLTLSCRDGNIISAVLREAWDSGVLRTLTKHSPMKATDTHICVIAHITEEELRPLLSNTQIHNGFANRFLWVHAKRARLLPNGGSLSDEHLIPFAERLKLSLQFAQENGDCLRRSRQSRELWSEEYSRLTMEHSGNYGAVTSRAEAQVLRLSMIYALLDCSRIIKAQHLKSALSVWKYCEESARYLFDNGPTNKNAARILEALRNADEGGLTRTDIANTVFSKNLSADQLEKALSELESASYARRIRRSSAGRSNKPVEVWLLA